MHQKKIYTEAKLCFANTNANTKKVRIVEKSLELVKLGFVLASNLRPQELESHALPSRP